METTGAENTLEDKNILFYDIVFKCKLYILHISLIFILVQFKSESWESLYWNI